MNINNTMTRVICLVGLLGIVSTPVSAKPTMTAVKAESFEVPLNKSRLIRLNRKATKISQSNPKIADYSVFQGKNEILLRGKSLGTTNLYVWYGSSTEVINVEVTHDLETLKSKLHELLPGENIEVRSAQKNIVLSGQVSGLDKMQAALDIAQSFISLSSESDGYFIKYQEVQKTNSNEKTKKGNSDTAENRYTTGDIDISSKEKPMKDPKYDPRIINMLSVSGAHQVMLEVKVAEIDRSVAKGLNIQFNALRPSSQIGFGALNGGGTFSPIVTRADAFSTGYDVLSNKGGIAGPIRSLLTNNPHSIDAAGLFLSAVSGDFMFNMTIDAAKDQNLAKILAEPTLTTLSGQEAKFLSGGEFPIPVPQTSNGGTGITIKFKEFGVGLRFLPVVLDTGRINLNMNVSVSELSNDAAVVTDIAGTDLKFSIPSLTKREASSTLELADGQTMSIAGLISDSVRENVNKFPGLGDVPVLGALFRNERFLKKQTELVIFVTPKLAKPVLASTIMLPTDSFVEPGDLDFYVFGKMEARDARQRSKMSALTAPVMDKGGLDGQFGHQLNEEMK